MERRLLVAIALMIVVAVVPSMLIKTPPRPVPSPADSAATAAADTAAAPRADSAARPAAAAAPRTASAPAASVAPAATSADSAWLNTPRAAYRFTGLGGAIDRAIYPDYKSFTDPDHPVNLVRQGDRMLVSRLLIGADTVRLDDVVFNVTPTAGHVTMTGTAAGLTVTLDYAPSMGREYLFDVTGRVDGLTARGALLLVGLGSGFAQHEADSNDNYRNYGVAVRAGNPESHKFSDVQPGESLTLSGPFDWVALKSKYFIGAVMSADSARPQLGGAILIGGLRPTRTATHAETWVTMPVVDGQFRYQVYLGPQENRNLRPLGRKLDRASPYGWIFKPIVMPAAAWITDLMVWMHQRLHLGYGLVLVAFGIMVRVVLWPLNQKAMKSQVAMMMVQPLMKDVQERYKDQPEKQQAEILKIYKEHKVNPFGGCLPLLLPWPVLLALFFVFANTIEFRGVPFLWLPDLSQRDPFFIIPVLMGASMWALSKLSQVGIPPNPQTKMMVTVMPVMMTVLFLNFASGLNLYYAVSNLVSLPQQYFINKSRMAEMERRKKMSGPR